MWGAGVDHSVEYFEIFRFLCPPKIEIAVKEWLKNLKISYSPATGELADGDGELADGRWRGVNFAATFNEKARATAVTRDAVTFRVMHHAIIHTSIP